MNPALDEANDIQKRIDALIVIRDELKSEPVDEKLRSKCDEVQKELKKANEMVQKLSAKARELSEAVGDAQKEAQQFMFARTGELNTQLSVLARLKRTALDAA